MSHHTPLSDLRFDEEDDPKAERRGDRRFLRRLVVLVVLVLGGLYAAGYAFASDRLPRGTTVAGVEVGGERPDDAQRRLRNGLADAVSAPIDVEVADRTFSLAPEEVGLDVDVPASIAQVPVGRSWNPADMWESLVGGDDYPPVVVSVDDLLHDRLEQLGQQVSRPPVEGTVTFDARGPHATYGEPGTVLDVDSAADAVLAAFPGTDTTVELTMEPVQPEVSKTEVSRAMKEFANPAMSGSVTLTLGRREAVLQPTAYARALSMEPRGGALVPAVNGAKLLRIIDRARPTIDPTSVEPVDASVRIQGGRPVVVPARKGRTIDADRLEKVFLDLVATTGGPREAEVPTRASAPELTTKDVRRLGITEKVSEFTTYYPHADYRNTNIGRAAEIIDGTILKPGETFSLNDTVGERTRANGFTEGFIISDGVFKEDLGGGVSQVATTLFNAAFFAGLEDVEHKPHSFYIDRYPVGREATVAWPTVDLKFRNDTGHGVLIQAVHRPSSYSSQGSLTVRMWSTKVWDIEARTGDRYAYTSPETRYLTGDDCVPNSGYSGFQIDVTRVFRKSGEPRIDHTERFHTTYTPSDSVVCR